MTENDDRFDQNLNKMFHSALEEPSPAYQEQLVSAVLAETARERRRHQQAAPSAWAFWHQLRLHLSPVNLAIGSVAILFVAVGAWWITKPAGHAVGQLSCLYGFVAVQHNGSSVPVSEVTDLRSGQRVTTQTGSKAQILLRDKSRLTPEPRTTLQVRQTRVGPKILLEQGTLSLEAAKQPAGKAITIEASQARVKVLGTTLDVRLIETPSGTRQTRVRVSSGQVEMESGGSKVLLPAGTEGVADENQPPVRASLVFEVNELIRLFNEAQTPSAAARRDAAQGLPSIVDLTTGTIWSLVRVSDMQRLGGDTASLRLKYPAFPARAYSLDGAELATRGQGQVLQVHLSSGGTPVPDYLILKVPGIGGLLRSHARGYELNLATDDTAPTSWVQFHLPGSARIEESPAVLARQLARDKLLLTVACPIRLPQLYE